MGYTNRFNDGHTHDKKNTSPKGYKQCSKCGKLMLDKNDMERMRQSRIGKGSKGPRDNPKQIRKTSKSRSHSVRSTGGTQVQSTRTIETIRYEDPEERDIKDTKLPTRTSGIPAGSVSQVRKTADFTQRLVKATIRYNSVKMLSGEALRNERQAISQQFRKFVN